MKRFACLLVLLLAMPASTAWAQREKLPPDALKIVQEKWPNAVKTSTGLRYVVLKEGEGDPVKKGDVVTLLYRGFLLDGKVFDETQNPSQPFSLRVGRGQVIQGWEQGLQLMRRGSRLVLIIPPDLAYGTRGDPPSIPRNATLVFEVELLDIKRETPAASSTDDKKK